MSGGVALFDYDNDGYLDIFFVNSLTVELLKANKKTRSVLYRNNRDGTFSDVTDKARVGDVGWGMGCAVGDFNNDGFDDLYVTSIGPDHLFKNNGNGTFTDVTQKAGVSDPRFSTGAAFLDYDNDGRLDLFVTNYVGFDINNLPAFGEGPAVNSKAFPSSADHGDYPARVIRSFATTVTELSPTFRKRPASRTRGVTTDWTLWAVTSTVMAGSTFSWPTTLHLISSITTMETAPSAKSDLSRALHSTRMATSRDAWESP